MERFIVLTMNVDRILDEMNRHQAVCLLIGGMNFLLNHKPVLTYDVDLWILDTAENRAKVHQALRALESAWGATEDTWGPLPEEADWLEQQPVYCLTSPFGAIDIFREVLGLENRFQECWDAAGRKATASGIPYLSLSDRHMLLCQRALPVALQNQERIRILEGR